MKLMSFLRNRINQTIRIWTTKNKSKIEILKEEGLKIGENTLIYDVIFDEFFPFLIEIGNNCLIASGVVIVAHDASPGIFLNKCKVGKVRIRNYSRPIIM